jgi:ferredoxin-NADP reductase
MKYGPTVIPIALLSVILIAVPASCAMAQSDHEKHHPQQQTSPATDSTTAMALGAKGKDSAKGMAGAGMGSTPDSATKGGGGGMGGGKQGGMGAEMGEMMKSMGKAPAKDLYPSLMQLPDMPPEKRKEIKQLADDRVNEGNGLLFSGLEKLTHASKTQDFLAMQEANEEIRRGQTLLASGLSTQRALSENQNLSYPAFRWFRQSMNLAPTDESEPSHPLTGLSWFHYIVMFTLIAFAAMMIWMYFHKMKRANALVAKLGGKTKEEVPPPGEPKPAAPTGTPKPAAKPDGPKAEATAVNPEIAPSKPNSWSGTLLVSEIFDETPKVKTFRLLDPKGGKLPFNYLPGQFITVTINPKGVPVKRSYTIASSPTHRDYCEITVKHEEQGTVSHYMFTEVHIGELMQFTAPSGKFTFTEDHAKSAVFIAGGVGVTPMMSAIRYLTDRSWKGEIYFFFTCKNESSIIFKEEIRYLEKRYPNLHVFFILSQPEGEPNSEYISGHITKEIISERVPEIASRMIHVCGPKSMMDAVKVMLEELKIPKENIMVEAFAGPPPAAKAAATPPAKGGKPPDANTAASPEEPGKPPSGDDAAKPSQPEQDGKTGVVTFAKSNKTAVLTPDKSILEASEEVGVNIDYSCRVGTCGICKTKLNSGKVTMAVEDALTEDDKAQNIILACQAKATEDVSVDA